MSDTWHETPVELSDALTTGTVSDSLLRAMSELKTGDISPELEDAMLMALSDTNDPRLRNLLAISLAEAKSPDVIRRITRLLYDEKTAGQRGSLLYAIQKAGAGLPLTLLTELILTDSAEASEEAFMMLEELVPRAAASEKHLAANFLMDALSRAQAPNLQVAGDALHLLMDDQPEN